MPCPLCDLLLLVVDVIFVEACVRGGGGGGKAQ